MRFAFLSIFRYLEDEYIDHSNAVFGRGVGLVQEIFVVGMKILTLPAWIALLSCLRLVKKA